MRSRVTDRAKNHLILLAMLVLLGLTGVVAVVRSPVLGLDLRGGLEVVLKAVPNDPKNPPTQDQINQAISIIRSRVDKLGVSEPEIRKEANNQVSIALAGIKDPKAAASIIGSTGQLFMLDYTGTLEPVVSKSASGQASYRPSLYALLNAAKNRPNTHYYEGSTPEQWYAFDSKTHKRLVNTIGQPFPPGASKQQLLTTCAARRRTPSSCARRRARSGRTTRSRPRTAPRSTRFVMFRMPRDKNMVVFGRDVRNAKSDYDPQSAARRHDGLLGARARRRSRTITQRAGRARAPHPGHRGAVRGHPRQQDRGHADDLLPAHAAAASTATRRSRGSRPARPTASRSCCSRAPCRSRSTRSRSRRSRPRSARTRSARP